MGEPIDCLHGADDELEAKLIAIRRQLHRYPELANEEYETTEAIREWLRNVDIRLLDLPLATGVVAEIGRQEPGPVVALRADIDALPIQEATGLSYASSVAGKMHACGHDFHTASLLGAATLLKRKEKELRGCVRLLFQPAEEKGIGAQQMIKCGALDGVQLIFGMHNKPDLPVGTIGIRPGSLMSSVNGLRIEIKGVSTHAAIPHAGVDPILVSAHLITALQTVVSRNVSAVDSAVISITKIHAGNTWNVIPELAVLEGTVRTLQPDSRIFIRQRIEEIAKGIAATFGAEIKLRWTDGPPAVHNNKLAADIAGLAAQQAGLHVILPEPSTASEDFAYYQQHVAGAFVFMGTSGNHEWHHPAFTVNERAIWKSARYFEALAELALLKLTIPEAEEIKHT
ncbi:amidohydrolase [Paenibacillus sp. ACRRX]|uniref:amidohydrolase n=1 Tax=Paenibacillus sp. ACRRX TaxID=2918206 RepID=UPI001EF69407|nr:amidohydrolase [Paenibacillus sp. ACRRX]MCG7407372.1 amidohydrolase [Paenibacillus sp. ACRRX]